MSVIQVGNIDIVDEDVDGGARDGEATSGQSVSVAIRPPTTTGRRRRRDELAFGLIVVTLLSALIAWLGIRAHAAEDLRQARAQFLEAGRQSAIMLTTVKHDDVDADTKRIIDSSTGAFLADFRNRSQNFVDTVRRTQSNTEGTVAEAGLESVRTDGADVLVAVSVKTSLAGIDSPARLWRMRIAVQRTGDEIKLSNVEFIA
ncbi:mammalian cell entry protein [Mycobacterium sp. CVI_P3]|uniref:Mammalian cell entry protein n=1 Tax=Mycobacterium pinniadriaticum TaxID=2994102 RepID=A0ABT3SMV4_9MYCO|nr:mammalian cell entry protein [Mycobacterium pinniadriaticum]MCX2934076.1 mammalian cell entry protein [Mycobacterium pinniadriaticum]MCX2940498.1 mammalian cell entry protein [Mycobacterium pinniadriaticum]